MRIPEFTVYPWLNFTNVQHLPDTLFTSVILKGSSLLIKNSTPVKLLLGYLYGRISNSCRLFRYFSMHFSPIISHLAPHPNNFPIHFFFLNSNFQVCNLPRNWYCRWELDLTLFYVQLTFKLLTCCRWNIAVEHGRQSGRNLCIVMTVAQQEHFIYSWCSLCVWLQFHQTLHSFWNIVFDGTLSSVICKAPCNKQINIRTVTFRNSLGTKYPHRTFTPLIV